MSGVTQQYKRYLLVQIQAFRVHSL